MNHHEIAIFVVNLKADGHKRERVLSLCSKFELEHAKIFPAVNGALLPSDILNGIYNSEIAIQKNKRELSRGEIGCALSHINLYKKIMSENIEIALILEDDIAFSKDFKSTLDDLLQSNLPEDWELILLGHHIDIDRYKDTRFNIWSKFKINQGHSRYRPSEVAFGTYGYLINNRGAARLLEEIKIIEKPIDHYTGDSSHVNNYIIVPSIVKVDEYTSDNYHSMNDRKLERKNKALRISWKKRWAIKLGIYGLLNSVKNTLLALQKNFKG